MTTRYYWRAEVIFASGHIEYIEFDTKSHGSHVYKTVNSEVAKFFSVDPIVYPKRYWIISCKCYEGPRKGFDDSVRSNERGLISLLRKRETWELNELRKSSGWNFGFIMAFLAALKKAGLVEIYTHNNTVSWFGGSRFST